MVSTTQLGVLIALLLAAELLIRVIVNPRRYFSKILDKEEQEHIREFSHNYQSRALAVAGLGLALGSIILSSDFTNGQENNASINTVIFLIGVSIGLLIISNQTSTLTRTRQIFFALQKLTLDYGFLTLIVAIILFFETRAPSVGPILLISLVIIAGIRSVELGYTLYIDLKMWKRNSETRVGYLRKLV
ncbi:hypothetical protein [Natrinema salaciae]|uniref:Uncharacterized protein n=1 Tax=Natrinema salaciae TaxID=1186196 RepID=A0A1H9PW50_9EURY|nr:hypothetical protein [Natrinema salaciae]SER52434.1 hypothetical protein SAMN04489841_4002 [Natrinema salaciae]